jgi:hypothetical protein
MGLRVVTLDFRPPGFRRAFFRYTVAFFCWVPIVAMT